MAGLGVGWAAINGKAWGWKGESGWEGGVDGSAMLLWLSGYCLPCAWHLEALPGVCASCDEQSQAAPLHAWTVVG